MLLAAVLESELFLTVSDFPRTHNPRVDLVLDSFQIVLTHQTEKRILVRHFQGLLWRSGLFPMFKGQVVRIGSRGGRPANTEIVLFTISGHDCGTVLEFSVVLHIDASLRLVWGLESLSRHEICHVVTVDRQ